MGFFMFSVNIIQIKIYKIIATCIFHFSCNILPYIVFLSEFEVTKILLKLKKHLKVNKNENVTNMITNHNSLYGSSCLNCFAGHKETNIIDRVLKLYLKLKEMTLTLKESV